MTKLFPGLVYETPVSGTDPPYSSPAATGLMIAGGPFDSSNTVLVSSTDGSTWSRISGTPLDGASVYGLSFNGSLWLAGGNQKIMSSTDGLTWTQRFNATGFAGAFVWTGSQWVATGAFGSSGRIIVTSPDGITWTEQTSPNDNININGGNCLAWSGSLLVCGGSGWTHVIMTSPDGVTWTPRSNPFDNVFGVVWGNSLFVAVGNNAGNTQMLMTSPDGITWTTRSTPLDSTGCNGFAVAWNGSLFVAVGNNGNETKTVITSPDGVTWTLRSTPCDNASNGFQMFGVAWSPNLSSWLVVGSGSTGQNPDLATSPDGITWTGHSSPLDDGDGYFAAAAL